MRWLLGGLLLILVVLQYRLWIGEGSLAELSRLEQELERQQSVNQGLRERNRQLELEVLELQRGLQGLEERARRDLGMIREGETYYQLVEERDTEATE